VATKHAALTLVLFFPAIASACTSDGTVLPQPHALYGPQTSTALTPYPSNRYTRADATTKTGLRVAIAGRTADVIVAALPGTIGTLEDSDGFSTLGGVYATFTDDLDRTTFTRDPDAYTKPGTPMALVDVDPASPEMGRAHALIPRYVSSNDDLGAMVPDFTLVAEPATPLRPKTRYAFVLTDTITTTYRTPLVPTDDTKALLSGGAEGDYGASVRAAMPIVGAATGIAPEHVALATVFTTESVHDTLLAAAGAARAAAPPKLSDTLVVNEMGTGADDLRVRFAGHFPAPDYRAPKPDGKWYVGADGKPTLQSTASLEFYLAFSDRTHSGPRPVAIFQHGLGSDKDFTWGTTDRLKALGIAVIGIDAPEHGSRATPPYPPGMTDIVKATTDFFGINTDTKTFDVAIARDNFRQMACDQLEELRFVQALGSLDVLPLGAPDGVPDIDPTKVIYLGHSFGSVMAATFLALAPEVRASVWNVGGAGLGMLFEDSALFSIIVKALEPPNTTTGQPARFFSTIQGILDPGDAANYAHYVTTEGLPGVPGWAPRDVLIEEVIDDNIVPNSSAERYARAAGLAQVGPVVNAIPGLASVPSPASANLANGVTGGIFQFAMADGMPVNHGGLIFTNDAIKQYTTFFGDALTKGRATIVAP
jgi:pimeloyl-ACP methyl ester carboxylesterase